MDRKEVLLRACYNLLMRQVESGYVLNLLDEIVQLDNYLLHFLRLRVAKVLLHTDLEKLHRKQGKAILK